jgi:type I restriction enzyme M protein
LGKKNAKKTVSKPDNYTLDKQPKITFEFLKSHLLSAIDILRGPLDPSEFRQPIVTILFLKRLNDVFEENAENLIKKGKSEKEAYENKRRHYFFVPHASRWSALSTISENIGEKIDDICRTIERENKDLEGVLTNTRYNDKKKFPDDKLRELVSHFNYLRLRNADLEKEDIFGDAYENLLEEFADQSKKGGEESFTPKEIVNLVVKLVDPKEGMKICDPTCRSGSMLIESKKYVYNNGGNPRNLVLEGQEHNYGTLAICKMNLVLHNIVDFRIEFGDILTNPRLVEGGQLKKYDKVLANFPFGMDWGNKQAGKDSYQRFKFGVPSGRRKADFAYIQHMFSSLNNNGQAAIICSNGVLSRGHEEAKIRENMIKEGVIEGVIALPPKLFFGSGISGCILLLNNNKSNERKNKIIFIDATKGYHEGKTRNLLREQDIDKIVSAFKKYRSIKQFSHISNFKEIEENGFVLNPSRYIMKFSGGDEKINSQKENEEIQKKIDELIRLENESFELTNKIKDIFKNLGYSI